MKLSKRILKSKFIISLGAWLIAAYIRFVGITTKWHRIEHTNLEEWRGKAFLLAFWHGRLLMIPYCTPRKVKANILISNHSDGEIIAQVQEHFGFGSIRGSSGKNGKQKGGSEAIRGMIAAKERKEAIVITPDGPRGPAKKVSATTVKIAKMLDLPIIPVTFSVSRCKIAKSWDSFMIAKPFGKGVYAVGEPILPENAHELEAIMNKLTEEADFAVKTL